MSAVSRVITPDSCCKGLAASPCSQPNVLHRKNGAEEVRWGRAGCHQPLPKALLSPRAPSLLLALSPPLPPPQSQHRSSCGHSPYRSAEGLTGAARSWLPCRGHIRENLFVLLLVQREGPSCRGRRRAGRDCDARVTNGPLSSHLLCLSVALTLPRTSYLWNLTVFVFL